MGFSTGHTPTVLDPGASGLHSDGSGPMDGQTRLTFVGSCLFTYRSGSVRLIRGLSVGLSASIPQVITYGIELDSPTNRLESANGQTSRPVKEQTQIDQLPDWQNLGTLREGAAEEGGEGAAEEGGEGAAEEGGEGAAEEGGEGAAEEGGEGAAEEGGEGAAEEGGEGAAEEGGEGAAEEGGEGAAEEGGEGAAEEGGEG
ncbi:hypothetical protein QE152_g22953 [Popillia japonica]|uniref:Uncharacterized protein n=1 Tax=Popillia japonica TaxID=7064 RepID=A0AAW1KIW4_POPJA